MTAPLQVQRQAEEAERQQQALNAPKSVEETPAAAPAATAEPAPAPVDDATALRAQLDKEAHRYSTLQGMYEADRRRNAEQLEAMTRKIEELSRAPRAETPPAPIHQPSDVETFGEDTIEFVTRIAAAVAQKVVPGVVEQMLSQRLAPVAQSVSEVTARVQKSAHEEYLETLSAAVPDWRRVNEAPALLTWLAVDDPISGIPRQALLNDAHEKMDARRVAAMFNQFKQESGMPTTAAPAAARQPVDERAAMVEPARTASASRPQGGPKGKTYTRADIAQFYRDSRTGRYTPAEADAIERDIILAQSENRIVG